MPRPPRVVVKCHAKAPFLAINLSLQDLLGFVGSKQAENDNHLNLVVAGANYRLGTRLIFRRDSKWQFAVSSQAWNVSSTGKCQRISTFNGFHALARSLQAGLPFSLVFASQKKDFVPRKLA